MSYTVALPDGRTVEFPDDVPKDKAAEIIKQQLGGQKPPTGGILGALGAGGEGQFSSARTGIESLLDANKAVEAAKARQESIQQRYAPQAGWQEVEKAYKERGLLPAVGEYISQIPSAMAEQAPQLAASMAGARLGGAAAGPAGAVVGAVTPSYLQMYGANLERQAEEQRAAGQPVDVNRLTAALTAVPQTALDVAATYIPLGRSLVGKLLGKDVAAALEKTGAKNVEKLAEESLKKTLAKGYGVGLVAEIPTEVMQQMLERAQAGLSLTDSNAMAEYGQTAFQVSKLAPMGAVGRYSERAAAQDTLAERRRATEAAAVEAQKQAKAEEEAKQAAYRQTPEYLNEISAKYKGLTDQLAELDRRANAKPDKNDLAAQADVKEARQQRTELRNSEEFKDIVEQYRAVAPQIKAQADEALRQQQITEGMKTPGAQADLFGLPSVEDRSPVGQLKAASAQIADIDTKIKEAEKAGDQQSLATLNNQRNQIHAAIQPMLPTRAELTETATGLQNMLEQAQTRMGEAKTTDEIERHAQQAQKVRSAIDQLKAYDAFVAPEVDQAANASKLKRLKADLNKAVTNGDDEKVLRLTPQIRELEQATEAQGDLFGAPYQQKLALDEAELARQMAEGRDNAKRIREKVEAESETLRRLGKQKGKRTPAEQAAYEKRLEEARTELGKFNADQERLANAQESETDWDRLVQNPANAEHQEERDERLKELTARVADLEAELERSPDREPTPQEQERAAWEIRSKQKVSEELALAQQHLADVQQRVDLGDRYRRQGAVADTEIVQGTDQRVADLLDRLLPGALAKPAEQTMSERVALQREAKEAAGNRLSLLQDIDALHQDAKQTGQHTQKQIARLRVLRDDYINEGVREANALRELNGQPPLSQEERRDLSLELRAVVDELARASIRRNADNSYEYGRVRGLVTEKQLAEGALPQAEVTAMQDELSGLQQLKLQVLEPRLARLREETLYLLEQGRRADDQKFVNEKLNSPEIQALRQRIAMVDLRINELVPVIGAHIRGENIETVVVPAIVRGSDADLLDRAFGSGTKAFAVLEEQANNVLQGYAGEKAETAKPQAKRVIELPIMTAQRHALELASAKSLLAALNAQISKAGNPNKPKLVEARNLLVSQRNDVKAEIARLEKTSQRLVELEQPTALPEGKAEPTTADLFGPLEAERADLAPLRKRLDELYKQRQQHQDRMQQRQQVATTPQMQALLDKFAKEPTGTPQLDEQIARLEEQLAAKTGKVSQRYSDFVAAREAERLTTAPEEALPSLEAFIDGLRRRGSLLSDDQLTELYWRNRALRDQQATTEEAAPEQRMLPQFGLKQFTELKKAVEPAAITAARTQAVNYKNRIEGLRRALGRLGGGSDNGQFLSELDTKVKNELETLRPQVELEQSRLKDVADLLAKLEQEKKQRIQSPKNIEKLENRLKKAEAELSDVTTRKQLTDRYNALLAEQKKLAHMVQLAKVQATQAKQKTLLENELAKTENLYEKANEKADTLERRQRAFEQQEAVRTGATPGTLEAERLKAGEGYRTVTGKARTKPKKLSSWGMDSVPKAQEAKPSAIAKAAASVQQANNLVKAATAFKEEKTAPLNVLLLQNRKRLANLQAQVAALDPAANDTFGFDKTVEVQREIEALQAEIENANPTEAQRDGGERIRTGIQLVREGWNPKALMSDTATYAADVKAAEKRVAELEAQLNQMGAQYEALRTKVAPEAAAFMDVDAAIQELFDKGIAIDNEHSKAVLDYKVARRNLLVHQDEIGRFVRQEHVKAIAAMQREIERQQSDPRVAAATKESQAAAATLEATQQRLKDAEAKLELERGKARAEARAAENVAVAKTEDDVRQARQRALVEGAVTELHNLAGERYERDTTGDLAEAVQNNAKKMLGMAQTSLDKAIKNKDGEAAAQARADIRRYEKELAQAFDAGERIRSKVGEEVTKAQAAGAPILPGTRLAPRRTGPLVKEGRQAPSQFVGAKEDVPQGKQNPPRQAGQIRLQASDLNPMDANAVGLVTLQQQFNAAVAGSERKADLKAALDRATAGLTDDQVQAQQARGKQLLKTGEALEVVALREKLREANADLDKALADQRAAVTPAAKEIAQDEVDIAKAQRDGIQTKLNLAKAAADKAEVDGATQAANAVNKDINLSRGAVQTGLTEAELTDELERALGATGIINSRDTFFNRQNPNKVQIFATPEAFTDANEDYAGRIPSNAKGFVDPATNKAVLFANNIGKGEGLGVLLHEVGAHLGFKNLFNKAQYNALVQTVKNWAAKNDGSLEARIGKAAAERVEAAKTSTEQYNDELLAYAVEEAVKAGVQPSAMKKGSAIQNWLQIVLDGLKRALRAFGINPDKMKAGELVNLAYGAAQLEMRGTWHGSDAVFKAFDVGFAGTGEGVYDRRFEGDKSLGAGPYTTPDLPYAKYYQQAVPFGKAANETGYGRYSYQDYAESLAEDTQNVEEKTTAQLQRMFESNLLHSYLNSVANGGELNPIKNSAAKQYLEKAQEYAAERLAERVKTLESRKKRKASADSIENAERDVANALRYEKAVSTLDISKIRGLTERPPLGNLYRTLDAIPPANVYSVNSMASVGDRPKIDTLYKKYGPTLTQKDGTKKYFELENGQYPLNGLFYRMRDELGIEKTIALLKAAGIQALERINDRRYIERAYIDQVPEIVARNLKPVEQSGDLLFSKGTTSSIVGKEAGKFETLKGNLFGLAGRVQIADRLAAAEEAFLRAEGAGKLTSAQAMNARYFMRLSEQVTAAAGQFITNGPVRIVSEDRTTGKEFRYASTSGENLVNMSEHAYAAKKASGLSDDDIERMLTVSIAGDRANATPNGWNRLRVKNADAARAEFETDKAYLDAHPNVKRHIDAAKAAYKTYNNGLLDFTEQCGFLSKEEVERLKKNPYVPFYRIENGVVQLFTGEEHPIRIGNIKDSPDLQRMVGSSEHILPIFTSAVQNTFMLTRMAMRNKQQIETSDALYKSGFVTKMGKGPGPDNVNTVHYKIDGKPAFATIDADTFGIPADLIVKGMEGIKTTIPAIVRMLGVPADVLRKMVTRMPAYAVRQLIRDPMNAFLLSGVDGVPVANALKHLAQMRAGRSPAEKALMEGLAISSNIYSGDEKDMSMFLRDINAGKGKWDKAMGYLDTLALQADSATRATIYEDSLKKGLSQRDAEFRAFESQNFSRRGLSPSMQTMSTLIPFFNAQIQGLDVLYRSLTGKMPFAQQMEIQRKIMARGLLLMTGAMAYAMMMQDDDEYRKASPEERYGNFFVPVPGMKDKLKVPMPYEIGLLFMALPQALVDTAMSDTKAAEALKGLGKLTAQSAPGVIPAAGKPLLEAAYGRTLYGPIETDREKKTLLPSERYREDTSEAAKFLGGFTGAVNVSPLMIEHLVRGYTGSLGIAAMHMLDPLAPSQGEKASTPLSKSALFGGLFQNPEGRFIINRAYDRMEEIMQVKGTVEDMMAHGRKAEAKAFAQANARLLAMEEVAGKLRQDLGQTYTDERAIRANPKLTQAQKDALIEKITAYRNKAAASFYAATERTTRQ